MKYQTEDECDSVLDDFEIFNKVEYNLKRKIKIFHVFKPPMNVKNAAFFITENDQVYGIGLNRCAILGLGYFNKNEDTIEKPVLISELSGKKICEFKLSSKCATAFALSENNEVYVWGSNFSLTNMGQNDTFKEEVKYFKPTKIEFFDNKYIIQVSGVFNTYLALSSNGEIYHFTDKHWASNAKERPVPFLLQEPLCKFRYVEVSYQFALAISSNWVVYSCGNAFMDSALNLGIHKIKAVSELSRNNEIVKIVTGGYSIYILTKKGRIYYTTSVDPYLKICQIESEHIFVDILVDDDQLLCKTEEFVIVYQMRKGLLETKKKRYINFFEFYLEEYMATVATIKIRKDAILTVKMISINPEYTESSGVKYLIKEDSVVYECNNKFKFQFDSKYFARGGMGKVFLSVKKDDKRTKYAIKDVFLEDKNPNEIFREIRFMEKMDPKFITYLVNAWIECQSGNIRAFIQMEYYHDVLNKIIEIKPRAFKRDQVNPNTQMFTSLEFFVSCQMLKELVECVQYLHSYEKTYLPQADMIPGRELKNPERQFLFHRDIKPENVLISTGSSGRYLKLSDFGLTKIISEDKLLNTNVGTHKYKAPEIMEESTYGHKADIFSLGIVAQEIIGLSAEKIPGIEDVALNSKLKRMFLLISKMVDTNPNNRPECSAILESINELSNKSEVKMARVAREVVYLEHFENKFFFKFFKEKFHDYHKINLVTQTNENLTEKQNDDIILGPEDFAGEDYYSIDGVNEILLKVLNSASNGANFDFLGSLMNEAGKFALIRLKSELVNFSNVLSGCFSQVDGIYKLNESKMAKVLDKWQMVRQSLSLVLFRIDMENVIFKIDDKTPENFYWNSHLMECQTLISQMKHFAGIGLSTGDSAIFDAISISLFKTDEFSNIIRLSTFLIYFDNLDKFKLYCNKNRENYVITMLKILNASETVMDKDQKNGMKEVEIKIENINIPQHRSAIMAISSLISRPIFISHSTSYIFDHYSLNIKENQIKPENCVWLSCINSEDFLSLLPANDQFTFIIGESYPSEYDAKIFSEFKTFNIVDFTRNLFRHIAI